MAWKGESRRHSLARKGVKTVVDQDRRFDVSTFVARGQKLPEVDISYRDWSIKINADGTMKLHMGNLTTAGWYWSGDETDLGTFLMRMMGSKEQEQFIKDMKEEGVTFEMLLPNLLEHIDEVDGNGMYVLTGDNQRWKFGEVYEIEADSEWDHYGEQWDLTAKDWEEILEKYSYEWAGENANIDKFEQTDLYQEIKKKLIHELKTSGDWEDFAINMKNLKEEVRHEDMFDYDMHTDYDQFALIFDKWVDEKKKEGRVVKRKASGKFNKSFYEQHGVGKSKYIVNFHDGKKTHKDGSKFYDIRIFKNKKDLEKFKKELLKKGYKETDRWTGD